MVEKMVPEKKKIIFIVNPISGIQGKRFIVTQIDKNIDKTLFDYEVMETQHPGHATEIARQAALDDADIVCAVGGDGTVNETATALVHTNTALAIIPSGSGNGLARHLHIPIEPACAIELINSFTCRNIDYGMVNSLPFFCTCGVGFDAVISKKFSEAGKRGAMTYIENVIVNGLKYTPETYELDIYNGDVVENVTYKAVIVSCANASQYGNNAYIAPQASVRDGLLDITVVEPFNIVDAPVMAMQLFNGTLDQHFRVKTFRCERLVIRREKTDVMHCDGEPLTMDSELDVRIVPGALRCVCPLDEGVRELSENIQSMITSHFSDLVKRSEQILQNNLNQQRKIVKRNKEALNKIIKKS